MPRQPIMDDEHMARRIIYRAEHNLPLVKPGIETEYMQSRLEDVFKHIYANKSNKETIKKYRGYKKEIEKGLRKAFPAPKVANKTLQLIGEFAGMDTAQARNNMIFEQQIRLASVQSFNAISPNNKIAQAMVKIFYSATQRDWQGKDNAERNQAILEAEGETDLKTVFYKVLTREHEAVKRAIKLYQIVERGGNEDELPGTQGDSDYPEYMYLVKGNREASQKMRMIQHTMEKNMGLERGSLDRQFRYESIEALLKTL